MDVTTRQRTPPQDPSLPSDLDREKEQYRSTALMANVFLLSINELLSKLKNNISKTLERKKPTLWEILDSMLYDFVCMEKIQKNQNGFNFDIEYLSELKRRFEENNRRLVYLYRCNNLDDIDFVSFEKSHPQYSNETIEDFKKILLFY